MRILMIFVDGIGVGTADPAVNPFAAAPSAIFTDFLDAPKEAAAFGGVAGRADASLGIDGLPQSATGQTTLLTGVNAAAALGRHLNGFPVKKLKEILSEHSIFKRLTDRGLKSTFINVFNPLFFEAIEKGISLRCSATTLATMAAKLPFYGIDDLIKRRAIYQDFTNGVLQEKGFPVPAFSPREAGEILAESARRFDFCLYEYFQSDIAGHSQVRGRAIEEVCKLDEFLSAVLEEIDLHETSVLLTSDHGNLENLSTPLHTSNPVPVLLWGALTRRAHSVSSLLDITPLILDSFS
ncbi:MAG: metalloenzyme [Candidatus Abyssobacteria bacterium SURF_5]|uniref:Metalloenzyme n=1 Tax=Abyssobacteria bacterium (strain SURF_5) TaxID=2093360 RepID=A0A3A4NGT6_ABYX5|nr:MAG: metalloenzyme [Candidatus Abyssubacteria bacterium SURF_5]